MGHARAVSSLIISVFFLVLTFPLNSEASLQSGVPFDTYLESMTYANTDIYIPSGATKLTVTIRNGSGDLDLYLKYGSPAQGNTPEQLYANADARSIGWTADETIVLTPETTPPLREGVWYVATLNLNGTRTSFTLTATVEVPIGALPVPTGQEIWAYQPTGTCVANYDAASSKPICIQPSVSGSKTITVKVETQRFAAPVDLYVGVRANPIDSKNIYLLAENNQLKPFSAGYVPWRRNVTGPLSENIFGDRPLSGLPPGRYDLYFGAGPAGRTDIYYIWTTSYYVKPGPENVADGSAGFADGTLFIPNSQILIKGQYYDQTASVPENTLVGVVKSGKAYLYNTALGNVAISDDTTRRSVGLFVMDYFGDNPSAAASGLDAATSDQLLTYANPLTLKTGVKLTRLAEKIVDATNQFHRWAAIEGTDGSGPFFVSPPARYFDNNLLRLIGTYFGPKLGYTGEWFNASNDNEESLDLDSSSLTIETFGATWRLLPHFFSILSGEDSIGSQVLALLRGLPSQITGLEIEGLELGNQKDPKLVNALNNIDLASMFFEGFRLLWATGDLTEATEPIMNLACNLAMYATSEWYTGNGNLWSALGRDNLKRTFEDLAHDLPTAYINTQLLETPSPLFSFVDALALLDYAIEDVVMRYGEVIGSWAYDEVRMEPETTNTVDLFTYSWDIYKSCDETSTSCYPVPNYLKFYTNHQYDIFASSDMARPDYHGSWTQAGSTITLTPTDGKDCVSYYTGTLIYPHTIKGYYILGPNCANPGEKKYWMAQ